MKTVDIEKLLLKKLETLTLRSFRSLSFRGLSGDTHWTAFYEFFHNEGRLSSPDFYPRWMQFMHSGIWDGILLKGCAVVYCRPAKIVFEPKEDRQESNQVRRLHCIDGPALVWGDGYELYYIRGVQVPPDYVRKPESITAKDIVSQGNIEVRKAMIELVGMERFLEMFNATLVNEDTDASDMPRRLWAVTVDDEDRTILEVECPSKRDKHYLWMPAEMQTCAEAVAWSFGFEVPSYLPDVEA